MVYVHADLARVNRCQVCFDCHIVSAALRCREPVGHLQKRHNSLALSSPRSLRLVNKPALPLLYLPSRHEPASPNQWPRRRRWGSFAMHGNGSNDALCAVCQSCRLRPTEWGCAGSWRSASLRLLLVAGGCEGGWTGESGPAGRGGAGAWRRSRRWWRRPTAAWAGARDCRPSRTRRRPRKGLSPPQCRRPTAPWSTGSNLPGLPPSPGTSPNR